MSAGLTTTRVPDRTERLRKAHAAVGEALAWLAPNGDCVTVAQLKSARRGIEHKLGWTPCQ